MIKKNIKKDRVGGGRGGRIEKQEGQIKRDRSKSRKRMEVVGR